MGNFNVRSLDRSAQKTNSWLTELDAEFGWDDRQRTYKAARAVLHALRDRLPDEESAQLAAQLPLVLTGVYFDGWNPAQTPVSVRDRDDFLQLTIEHFGARQISSPEEMVGTVLSHLERHVSEGEIADVKGNLPDPILRLWPDA